MIDGGDSTWAFDGTSITLISYEDPKLPSQFVLKDPRICKTWSRLNRKDIKNFIKLKLLDYWIALK